MMISITADFAFTFDEPGDALLQFEAANVLGQRLIHSETTLSSRENCTRVAAHQGIGQRIWVSGEGRYDVSYCAEVAIERQSVDLAALRALPTSKLPSDVTEYLFGSRYCTVGQFQNFVDTSFEGSSGGARIEAIRSWIAENFTYEPGASGPETSAADSFLERRGICRDYAHVLVAMARASVIPARYVACYAPCVEPQDFHAVAEVFLADGTGNGAWHLVDATGMASAEDTAIIGVGRDAADVSFLTTFGPASFLYSRVDVAQVE